MKKKTTLRKRKKILFRKTYHEREKVEGILNSGMFQEKLVYHG